MPTLTGLDHLVLTVMDIDRTIGFYRDVLGMQPERFQGADGVARWALHFGAQKINLHQLGHEFEPKAGFVAAGSADLCFLSETPITEWLAHLSERSITCELGPIKRTGACGPIRSIYVRDPDANLIEIANQA